jgi:phospholipase C
MDWNYVRQITIAGAICGGFAQPAVAASAGNPIQHVIIIFQENRSFDNYFGTFPGANGIPAGVCLPISLTDSSKGCVTPFHDRHDYNLGGDHDADGGQNDLDNGITQAKMDGFVDTQMISQHVACAKSPGVANCSGSANGWTRHDVMGYHTAEEIPNYWSYAQHFVLQDAMFPGIRSWSTPSHVDLTAEWMGECVDSTIAATCHTVNSIPNPQAARAPANWPWVSMFELLDQHSVSWKYYLTDGSDPDCDDQQLTCEPSNQNEPSTPIWNPPQYFAYTKGQGAAYLAEHNPTSGQFWTDIKNGTLPQVSWVMPNSDFSEHPYGGGITLGMEYVTSIVNAVMQSPYWQNTVIFLTWDDWGGFYDNVVPPTIEYSDPLMNTVPDQGFIQGLGIRVPALTISPWVKAGLVDHQVLSFASYNAFIEDLFMNGARLDPVAMGRPDARPSIRDAMTSVNYPDGSTAPVGNIMNEFDFTQTPLPPLVLSTHIPGKLTIFCHDRKADQTATCQLPTVTISWNPIVGPGIAGPFTYHILRDGIELPQCVGTGSTCTDTPGSGNHFYTAYSIDSNNVASPLSAAAEADEP